MIKSSAWLNFYFSLKFSQKACGSLTNLLKIRGGAEGDELNPQVDFEGVSSSEVLSADAEPSAESDGQSTTGGVASSNTPLKKQSTDIPQKMSSQIDKLDSLLTKAENAQYSMAHQNKQMKSFLKK